MKRKTSDQTLIASFKTMFPDAPVSSNALIGLEMQDLKDAYRRLAKKYHPDVTGSNAAHARSFAALSASYEILTRFIVERNRDTAQVAAHQRSTTTRGTGASHSPPSGTGQTGRSWRFTQSSYKAGAAPQSEQSQSAGNPSDTSETSRRHARKQQAFVHHPPPDPGMKHEYFHQGEMPQKRMQLGMYLYHKGIISYQALARALAWQRSCRPPFGELAKSWGFMTEAGINATLRDVDSTGTFGDRAMALGHLRKDQRGVVVLHQLSLQPVIGRYFVVNRFVTERQLMQCITEMNRHNSLHLKS